MGFKLSVGEIKKRLIRLGNLECLHKKAKKRIGKQAKKIEELEEKNKEKDKIIAQFTLQLEELRIKVFGKKKGKKENNTAKKKKPIERTAESYKRPQISKGQRRRSDKRGTSRRRERQQLPNETQKKANRHMF